MVDLSFKEGINSYQMFLILFKLLKTPESQVQNSSNSSSSSDSLLLSLSSNQSIIIRALLLSIYKSFSQVYEIQVFFVMFLPYVFQDEEARNEIITFLQETEEVDVERILVKAIDIYHTKNRPRILSKQRRSVSKERTNEHLDLSTLLLKELNLLIGSDLIPLKEMIHFAVKVVLLLLPADLTVENEDYGEDVHHELKQKYPELHSVLVKLPGLSSLSTIAYLADFESYDTLFELLVFSVKLSFAVDEIDQNPSEKQQHQAEGTKKHSLKPEFMKILDEIWSSVCHKNTAKKIYSFLTFVKYKLHNKVLESDLGIPDKTQNVYGIEEEVFKGSTQHSGELFNRTGQVVSLVFDKLMEVMAYNFHHDMIIDRAMNPVLFVISKLLLENSHLAMANHILAAGFEKFDHMIDLYAYFHDILDTKEDDNVFESSAMDERGDFKAFENARDNKNLERTLITEQIMTYFELISSNKSEIDYLSRYFAAIIEDSLKNLSSMGTSFLSHHEDKSTVPNVVILIMLSLYNLRHQYKIIEEASKASSPSHNKPLLARFKVFETTVNSLWEIEPQLTFFIKPSNLSFDAIISSPTYAIFTSTISNPSSFTALTTSLLHMLKSTSIACPQLSICLIQCWFPLAANCITSAIKKGVDTSVLVEYNVGRSLWVGFLEALMIGFKRIWVTKSFEITQIKVIIQCMIRIVKLKAEIIEYDELNNEELYKDMLMDDYMYWCNMIFWVCVSWLQSAVNNSSNKSVKSIINIGVTSLVSLFNEHIFREFFWETVKFTRNFENYSVFSFERREHRTSAFSNNELEGNFLSLHDLIFKCIAESEQSELMSEFEYLLSLDIKDNNILSHSKFENEFIRYILLIIFKNVKMKKINDDKKLKSKEKFQNGLQQVHILNTFLPEIDEFNRSDMDSCLKDLEEILSNFYSGDEFPFNAI